MDKDDILDLKEFYPYKVSDDGYKFVNKCDIALKILNELKKRFFCI
jgi:hypothetical protein